MTLFCEKYRVESARLPGRTYTENGMYFITICTKNRECVFGKIRNGIMGLSDIGNVVVQEWQRTERVRYYVNLDRWIVMPNHIHGIIWIDRNDMIDGIVDTSRRDVSTTLLKIKSIGHHRHNPPINEQKSRLHPNSIGSIIGQFKSICTKQIRAMGYPDFAWQPRFYDHIIRDEKSLWAIRQYIRNNPLKWERDRNNPDFPDTP